MTTARRIESPVTYRRIGKEGTENGWTLTVFCPRQTGVVSVAECRACTHCDGLSLDRNDGDSFLRCRYTKSQPRWTTSLRPPEVNAETTVGAVMTAPVHCVTKQTPAGALLRLFLEQGISAAPVINDHGHAIGLVSKTDLLRDSTQRGVDHADDAPLATATAANSDVPDLTPLSGVTAGELMTPFVFSLSETAPISLAAALMSYEAVHRVVVTTADGSVVGMLSALDVMRWLAVDRGYTIPPRRRKERV